MPIYEYTCTACKHEFEVLERSMAGAEQPRCPSCDHAGVQRKLSVFAAQQASPGVPEGPAGTCQGCADRGHGQCPF